MPVQFKDYYHTLGVARDATEAEIKKAFRKLARQFHPDIARDKESAEEKFKEINEAYEVLGDPVKRRKYDELGAHWQDYERAGASGAGAPPPPGFSRTWRSPGGGRAYEFHFGGTTGFSDFFEQFFGTRSGAGGGFEHLEDLFGGMGTRGRTGAGRAPAEPGADTEADLLVTLEEAMQGAERTLRLERVDPRSGVTTTQTIKVRIPAGVREGQRLRVPGQGASGHGDAPAGDLYLRVRLAAHPDFRAKGDDLYYDLVLAPWEAVLGASIDIRLPGGQHARLRVPGGTRRGQQFRLKRHGLPNNSGGKGDLFAVVEIDVPSHVGSDERSLWEKLAHSSRFAPRRSP